MQRTRVSGNAAWIDAQSDSKSHLGGRLNARRGAHSRRCIESRLEGALQETVVGEGWTARVHSKLHHALALGADTRRRQRDIWWEALPSLCAHSTDHLEDVNQLALILYTISARAARQQRPAAALAALTADRSRQSRGNYM
jgi:hypothetical protein